jgi:hypothetical protein
VPKATAADRRHFERVVPLGCIICGTRHEIHHLTGAGIELKARKDEVTPLCPMHHRTGGYGVGVRAGKAAWERRFGS